MALVPKPKYVAVFSANFSGVGTPDEYLHLSSTYPLGVYWEANLKCGQDVFLETTTDIASVPETHLLNALAMSAILSGESLPFTAEYLKAVTEQDGIANAKNFQTIVGEVRLKPEIVSQGFRNPAPVDDLNYGPSGTVCDLVFQRGTGSNTKTIRTDGWSISQYGNRVDSLDSMYTNVAGAVFKQFPTYKKSNLGASDSAARDAVIDFIQTTRFWV